MHDFCTKHNNCPVLGEKNEINIINLLAVAFADSVLSVNDDTTVSIFTQSIRTHSI